MLNVVEFQDGHQNSRPLVHTNVNQTLTSGC